MGINCQVLVITLLCLFVTLHQGSGAIWHGIGCGENRKAGDSWFVSNCGVCNCYLYDHFSCYSCGVLVLLPKKGCYTDFDDRNAKYPKCCDKKYVCKGDAGFDSKKFDDYWKNKIIG